MAGGAGASPAGRGEGRHRNVGIGMAQPPLQLVIGNYNTSSWSLRAWLALRLARLAFTEIRIPLRRADTSAAIRRYSPSGKLPVLLVEGMPVWDSLSIAELVAELEPSIWPLDAARRAEARSISAEVHSGFADLRRLMPMDVVSRFSPPGRLPRRLAEDIARVSAIWRSCRDRHGADGPFLFGSFSLADVMMAPVASRLVTHAVPMDPALDDYVDSVMSWPDMVIWRDEAAAEVQELEGQGELRARSVTRSGREVLDQPAAQASPSIEPHVPEEAVRRPPMTLDVMPQTAPQAPVEVPAMPEPEPAAEGHQDEDEPAPSAAAASSEPQPEVPPSFLDDGPPDRLEPQPAAKEAEPPARPAAEPPAADRSPRPVPDERGDEQKRPAATTIKPIGSGILRRR